MTALFLGRIKDANFDKLQCARVQNEQRLGEQVMHAEGGIDVAFQAGAAAFDRLAASHRLLKRREGREPGGPSAADVARLAAGLGPDLGARATEALLTRRVATRAELERLTADLARLEREAVDRGDRAAKLGV